eukprot:2652797-Pleurochrysis_carterae.AAC.3
MALEVPGLAFAGGAVLWVQAAVPAASRRPVDQADAATSGRWVLSAATLSLTPSTQARAARARDRGRNDSGLAQNGQGRRRGRRRR